MRFLLYSPFRTDFNLTSLEASKERDLTIQTLTESVNQENALTKTSFWEKTLPQETGGDRHYSSLDEDNIPDTAKPLLKLEIKESKKYWGSLLKENGINPDIYQITSCKAHYYDNTVAILSIDLSIIENNNKKNTLQKIDEETTKISESISQKLRTHEERVLNNIHKINKKTKSSIFLSKNKFSVFFDRNITPSKYNHPRVLWTTRFLIEKNIKTEIEPIQQWTHSYDLLENQCSIGNTQISIQIGNSVIFSPPSAKTLKDIESSVLLSTYFYTLQNIFNKNLRTIFLKIHNAKKIKSIEIYRIKKIKSHIDFIENEFNDCLMGLQGNRLTLVTKLLEVWKYKDLSRTTDNKKHSVTSSLDAHQDAKQNSYTRVIEAILAAIGGVSILDFVLNLFTFSGNKKIREDKIPGIIDGARLLPVDGVLYGTMTLLIIFLFIVLRKR